jgi:hypothetical protein
VLEDAHENLPTNLPGGVGHAGFSRPTLRISPLDLPFMRFVDGTNDTSAPWSEKPVYEVVDTDRWGVAVYWDPREHTSGAGWFPAHFVGSPRHDAQWLTRYRRDRSFPAIHDVDHAPGVPGAQPDPGDAVVPANGDPFGIRAGWFDWDLDSIVDQQDRCGITLGQVTSASFPADVAPPGLARASVTIRPPQAFRPPPGQKLLWTLRVPGTAQMLQAGRTTVRADGSVTVPRLAFGSVPLRLEMIRIVRATSLHPH